MVTWSAPSGPANSANSAIEAVRALVSGMVWLLTLGVVVTLAVMLVLALVRSDPPLGFMVLAVAAGCWLRARAGAVRRAAEIRFLTHPPGVQFSAARAEPGPCGCCWGHVAASEPTWTCLHCGARQHAECAGWLQGCANYGCRTPVGGGFTLGPALYHAAGL